MDSLPNAHGCLEYAREHGADVVLRGWMVDAAGAFETMHCEVAQRAIAAAPIDRPDLEPALPRVPGVRGAGFHLELPLNLLDGDGRVEFEVVGSRVGRRTARLHAGWLRSAAALPLPPLHLMQRVAHTQLDYLFAAGGMKTAFDFAAAARRVRTPASFARILDWGCGCGRVTAHLPALFPQASIHGVDIDGEAVAWAAAHLGGGGGDSSAAARCHRCRSAMRHSTSCSRVRCSRT